jgi:ubiquinone/menaquinone biosynthesis C-methylase UbiE
VRPAERRARVAAVFDQVAGVYDQVGVPWFQPIAGELVRRLAPVPGERAVDIGCGRGAALFALAEAVGPGGWADGIDLAPRMVSESTAEARRRGLMSVGLHVMDAMTPRLPAGSYDVLAASFVLFFLPAPVAALRAWRKLLRPGGRLGLSTFAQSQSGALEEVFRPFLPRPAFGPDTFASDEGVERLLTAAGLVNVRTSVFEFEAEFSSIDQWLAWSWSHGQRAVWEQIPAADHGLVRAAAADHLERHRVADGRIRLPQRIRITLAAR